MRIIAGKFGGCSLVKSDHAKLIRPTTDKNRESLFNILSSGRFLREINFFLENISVLDLCCGTGALGIEALSRGAKDCVFVDNNPLHLEILKKNIEKLRIEKDSEIIKADVNYLGQNTKNYDLIFFDPPYDFNYQMAIENIVKKNWVGKNTLLVIEYGKQLQNLNFPGVNLLEKREYGNSNFGFFHC